MNDFRLTEENEALRKERDEWHDRAHRKQVRAVTAEARIKALEEAAEQQVQKLTAENERLRSNIVRLTGNPVDYRYWEGRYRDEATENERLREALTSLIRYIEHNECQHESVHRGGAIWTICDGCGAKWADDRGGFQPYQEPPELTAARCALETQDGGK